MSFRNEEKLRVASSKIFNLKNWINENLGIILFPTRTINSIYFDNQDYTMYNQSIEGVLPRKKIRLRVYGKEFSPNKSINKEIKISSVEGKYKISELVQNPSKLLNLVLSKGKLLLKRLIDFLELHLSSTILYLSKVEGSEIFRFAIFL